MDKDEIETHDEPVMSYTEKGSGLYPVLLIGGIGVAPYLFVLLFFNAQPYKVDSFWVLIVWSVLCVVFAVFLNQSRHETSVVCYKERLVLTDRYSHTHELGYEDVTSLGVPMLGGTSEYGDRMVRLYAKGCKVIVQVNESSEPVLKYVAERAGLPLRI